MRQRIFVLGLAAICAALCAAPRAHALSAVDSICRKQVGKAAKKLADTLLKEKMKCQKKEMLGKIMGVDCNDPDDVLFEGALKVAKARQKLSATAAKYCTGSTPQQLGYVVCRAPCQNIPITSYSHIDQLLGEINSVAACVRCRLEDQSKTAFQTAYGANPLAQIGNDDRAKCMNRIGSSLRKYFSTRAKEQQKCQYFEDLNPSLTDCSLAESQPGGKVNKALAKANANILKCGTPAINNIAVSCGNDVPSEQTCIRAAVEAHSDGMFTDIYKSLSGIFVSSAVGSPSGDGSILNPVDTIGAGMALATPSRNNIFIDGKAIYIGSVTLLSNVNLLGGFNSDNGWVRDGITTSINSTLSNPGLQGTSVSNTLVHSLTIQAPGTVGVGASAYGVRLVNPNNVVIRNSSVTAGNGGGGGSGSNGTTGGSGNQGANGANGCEDSNYLCSGCGRPQGGAGGTNPSCPTGSQGGQGGAAGHCSNGAGNGQTGQNGFGSNPGSGGAGGASCHGGPTIGGNAGNVAVGNNGPGAGDFGGGTTTYAPAIGGNGGNGTTGSGGGGGGGGGGGDATCDSYGGAGGGGGGGGCGGSLATGGTGAGGSFGIWINGGNATIDTVAISTGNGGAGGLGGTGGTGGSGAPGRFGGSGQDDSVAGANGGSGGNGGRGGHGGGGGGGPSIGIVCTAGAAVSRTNNTFNLGNGGAGGGSAGNAGATGRKVNENGC